MTLAHQFARALTPEKRQTLDMLIREFEDPNSALLVQYTMERDDIPQDYEQRAWDFVCWVAGKNDA